MEINVNLFSLLLGVGLSVLILILYLFILWVERRMPKRKSVFERPGLITLVREGPGSPWKEIKEKELDLILKQISKDNEAYEKERTELKNDQDQTE